MSRRLSWRLRSRAAWTLILPMTRSAPARTQAVHLRDIWPSLREVRDLMKAALQPEVFRRLYKDFAAQNPKWNEIPSSAGNVYEWDRKSTYIQEPPFFTNFALQPAASRRSPRPRWRFLATA